MKRLRAVILAVWLLLPSWSFAQEPQSVPEVSSPPAHAMGIAALEKAAAEFAAHNLAGCVHETEPDDSPAERKARSDQYARWLRAVAQSARRLEVIDLSMLISKRLATASRERGFEPPPPDASLYEQDAEEILDEWAVNPIADYQKFNEATIQKLHRWAVDQLRGYEAYSDPLQQEMFVCFFTKSVMPEFFDANRPKTPQPVAGRAGSSATPSPQPPAEPPRSTPRPDFTRESNERLRKAREEAARAIERIDRQAEQSRRDQEQQRQDQERRRQEQELQRLQQRTDELERQRRQAEFDKAMGQPRQTR